MYNAIYCGTIGVLVYAQVFQQRFLLSNGDDRQYYVPITYTVSNDVTKFSNTTVKAWLLPNESLTLSGVLQDSSWIVLNNRQSGKAKSQKVYKNKIHYTIIVLVWFLKVFIV